MLKAGGSDLGNNRIIRTLIRLNYLYQ